MPHTVYDIGCLGDHCDCQVYGATCRRGFFSLWIQAVYGLYFAYKHQVPGYVNFGNRPYLYSDSHLFNGDANFWNYYYQQENKVGVNCRLLPNNYVEDYPLRIWESTHLHEIHQAVVANLKLQSEVAAHVKPLVNRCRALPTLGLQIRLTDHSLEVEPVGMEHYHAILRNAKNRYEQFFIATDDSRVIDALIDEWGEDRIIYQPAVRSKNEQAIHTNMGHPARFRLGLEVLADCYALSACHKGVLVHSNISYAALLLNPKLPYRLLETSSSRNQRLKTKLLYRLDRWGIRKM